MSYATRADVKAWLGVEDTKLDAIVDLSIPAAEAWINGYCHRTFALSGSATPRYFDVNPVTNVVYTDDIGDASSVLIAVDNSFNGTFSTSWAAGDYQLEPLNQGFDSRPFWQITSTGSKMFPFATPTRNGLVRVTAKWGWPAVPDAVRLACIMQTARLVSRRSSPNGVAGFNDLGAVRVASVDRDIEALLAGFMLVRVG